MDADDSYKPGRASGAPPPPPSVAARQSQAPAPPGTVPPPPPSLRSRRERALEFPDAKAAVSADATDAQKFPAPAVAPVPTFDEATIETDARDGALLGEGDFADATPTSATDARVPQRVLPPDEFEDDADDVPSRTGRTSKTFGSVPPPPPSSDGTRSPTANAKRTMMGLAPAAVPVHAAAPPYALDIGSNPFPVAAPTSVTKTIIGLPKVAPPSSGHFSSALPPPPSTLRTGLTPPPTLTPPGALPVASPPRNAARASAPNIAEPSRQRSLTLLAIVVGLLAAGLMAMLVSLWGGAGSLTVTVSGADNELVPGLRVFLDGKEICTGSPCRLGDVEDGTHFLRVEATGYTATAEQAINVASGKDATRHVSLARSGEGAGLLVEGGMPGLTLSVDGKWVGPLPQDLPGLTPGSHAVRVAGNSRYSVFEQQVVVQGGSKTRLGPITLSLLQGRLLLRAGPGSEGARVTLDGKDVALPVDLDLSAERPHEVRATRSGFRAWSTRVTFDATQPEVTLSVALEAETADESATETGRTSSADDTSSEPTGDTPYASGSAPGGAASLNINSIPSSKVVLDGKPLGTTPRSGISVKPGAHTVIFIHSKHGRKTQRVEVAAGEKKTVVVRFP